MNYTREALEKSGLTQEKLKSLCESVEGKGPDDKFKKLIDEIGARIQDGVDRNLGDYRHWWALEKAHDAPFYQVSFTLLRDLVEKDYDSEKVTSLLNDYGLSHMMEPVIGKDGQCEKDKHGQPVKALNIPIFFRVFVPLCQAYKAVRWAKLFNDRDQTPLYRYDPAYSTKDNRLRCEIWTSRTAVMAQQYGYVNDEKQAIFQALHYGICLKFIKEAWHREEQEVDGKDKIVREGLRFQMPTPDRFYYDLNDRLSTLNSDSGCSYLGYWHIERYGSIFDSPDFWNKDKISYGGDVDIITKAPSFFSTIYPCTLKFPPCGGESQEGNDRESAANYYTSAENDSAVLLTQHFQKLIPNDFGISRYKHPIWMRIVMANKQTPVFMEPIFCAPAAYYGYDADNNRRLPSSLTLELMPWQDHIGNILSQWIYSAKQNLASPVFVDREVVPKEAIDTLKNMGEKSLRGITYIDFSSSDLRAQLADKREAFYAPAIPKHNTAELRVLMMGILDVLERTLQFSPQETGQAATHEQSATESNIINNNVGNRVRFTGSFIDDGMWATKKMIYDASVVNADDNIYAEVSGSYADSFEEFKKLAEKVGVEIVDKEEAESVDGRMGRARVKAPKAKLLVEGFSTSRDADQRPNNPGIAAAAAQILQSYASNEALLMGVGIPQIVELTNQICSLLGLPKDFRLKYSPPKNGGMPAGQEIMQEFGKQLEAFAKDVLKRIEQGEKAAAGAIQQSGEQVMKAAMEGTQQQLEQLANPIAQRFDKLEQAVVEGQQMMQQIIQQRNQPPPPQQLPVPIPMPVMMGAQP